MVRHVAGAAKAQPGSVPHYRDGAPGYSWQVLDCAPHEVAEAVRREEAEGARERADNLARARARVAARRTRP